MRLIRWASWITMIIGSLAVSAGIGNWLGLRIVFAAVTVAAFIVMTGLVITAVVLRLRQGHA